MGEASLNMTSVPNSADFATLNEMRAVFLGDGEAGKSHILARLLNDGGEPLDYTDQSVPGVIIKTSTIPWMVGISGFNSGTLAVRKFFIPCTACS